MVTRGGELTGGALDVTIGPLVDAWGFGPSGPRKTLPTNDEIARLREAMGPDRMSQSDGRDRAEDEAGRAV